MDVMVHVVVFAKYATEDGKHLIADLGFLDEASSDRFHVVLVGYSDTPPDESARRGRFSAPIDIAVAKGTTWYYDPAEFVRQMKQVEANTTWRYDGGIQLLVLDVPVAGRQPATITQMFEEKRANLRHVITVGIDELKEKGLARDFDTFFQKLRQLIPVATDADGPGPTFMLSDRLGLSQGGLALNVLLKAFGLKWDEALEGALKFKHLAVRDIRRPGDRESL